MDETKSKAPRKRKRKRKLSEILLYCIAGLVMLIGIGLISYPTVSDWWNSRSQSKFISSYTAGVAEMDPELIARIKAEAQRYNESLVSNPSGRWHHEEQTTTYYKTLLNPMGNGVMGSIVIPKIKLNLPFYHTAEENVIQVAVGHIEGTSLPIGGPSTHCALSSHRGLPSAKLFTDLDELEIGDTFILKVLDEVLTYQIDNIEVVLPTDMDLLDIIEGKDYCTLVTCTPYGVNSHRLLIRGERIPTTYEEPDNPYTEVAPIVMDVVDAVPWYFYAVAAILLVVIVVFNRRRRRRSK